VGIIYDYVEFLRVLHFLFFRDMDYLAKQKEKIWINIRRNALKRDRKEFYKKKYEPYVSFFLGKKKK